jgi:hypothetical protein
VITVKTGVAADGTLLAVKSDIYFTPEKMLNNDTLFTADIPPVDAGFKQITHCGNALYIDVKFSIELLYNPILCKTIS